MATGRMLNRSISMSVKFNALPDDTARLLATWLIAQLDVRGVFYAEPMLVKSLVFPMRHDVDADAVSRILNAMEAIGLIVRFEALGRRWMAWPGFADNQPYLRGERERTDFPPPPEFGAKTTTAASFPQGAGKIPRESRENPAEEKRREEKGNEVNSSEGNGAHPRANPPARKLRGFGEVITTHDDPRVAAYLEIVRSEITPTYAHAICERVKPEHLDAWRATLTLWASHEWRATNFAGMFERYEAAVNGARVRGANGHASVFEGAAQLLEARAKEGA